MQDELPENDDRLAEPLGEYQSGSQIQTVSYINPLWDQPFKRIFASETSKEVLRSFLNAVLEGIRDVQTVTYGKNEYPGDSKAEGNVSFDVICTDSDGTAFLVEVQRENQKHFKERSIVYASRLISDQVPRGQPSWKYDLKDVYVICLLEKLEFHGNDTSVYRHDACVCDKHTGKVFYDKLDFIYLELKKFSKEKDELHTSLDEWLYALKHAPQMDQFPSFLKTPELVHFFDLAEYSNLTPQERNLYLDEQMRRWDNQNALDYALEKAEESGHAAAKLQIARNLKSMELSAENIATATGLSIQQIEEL